MLAVAALVTLYSYFSEMLFATTNEVFISTTAAFETFIFVVRSFYIKHNQRWALIRYFVISFPLVTTVSLRSLVSLSVWIVSNE